jgi:hypothetical protein
MLGVTLENDNEYAAIISGILPVFQPGIVKISLTVVSSEIDNCSQCCFLKLKRSV